LLLLAAGAFMSEIVRAMAQFYFYVAAAAAATTEKSPHMVFLHHQLSTPTAEHRQMFA
jgi:hypothetical protein